MAAGRGRFEVRIGVVGTGIAGMAAAWLLSRHHEVDVFESEPTLGGHTHTVDLKVEGVEFAADTGFMVFNERTYPNLIRLFDHLDIGSQASDMSFSVRCADQDLEWSSRSLAGMFSQPGNILRAELWRLFYDVARLSAASDRLLADSSVGDLTLGELLEREGYSRAFAELYLVPMAAAIWSTPSSDILSYPAQTFLRFADNHGLLHVTGKPKWRTVVGGARNYVDALAAQVSGAVRTGATAVALHRLSPGCELHLEDGSSHSYDAVVLACHAPQSLDILADPTPSETELLSAFRYQPSRAILHSDASFLPRRRVAWASWNYHAATCDLDATDLSVTYYLNRLQNLPVSTPILLTLNPERPPQDDLVHDSIEFAHPVFDGAAIAAQERLREIQGINDTWYCGAWQRYGFHEDGLLSALAVGRGLGCPPPWDPAPQTTDPVANA